MQFPAFSWIEIRHIVMLWMQPSRAGKDLRMAGGRMCDESSKAVCGTQPTTTLWAQPRTALQQADPPQTPLSASHTASTTHVVWSFSSPQVGPHMCFYVSLATGSVIHSDCSVQVTWWHGWLRRGRPSVTRMDSMRIRSDMWSSPARARLNVCFLNTRMYGRLLVMRM